jgi:hypothetical protein
MEIDARGSEKSLSFCYLKIDNIFCVSRLTREGSGTTGAAAVIENRRFLGAEINKEYYKIAFDRISKAMEGTLKIREDKPVIKPNLNSAVAKLPKEFKAAREED